jgi:hypothetical protein
MRILKLLLLASLLPASTYAAWQPANSTVVITQIVVEGNGDTSRIYIRTAPLLEAGSCKNTSGASLIRLSPKNVTAESKPLVNQQLYSAALTAYTTGKPVQLNISSCDDWDRPHAISIWMK